MENCEEVKTHSKSESCIHFHPTILKLYLHSTPLKELSKKTPGNVIIILVIFSIVTNERSCAVLLVSQLSDGNHSVNSTACDHWLVTMVMCQLVVTKRTEHPLQIQQEYSLFWGFYQIFWGFFIFLGCTHFIEFHFVELEKP